MSWRKKVAIVGILGTFFIGCNVSDDPVVSNANNATNNATNNDTNNDTNMGVCDECGVCDDDPTNDCVQDCAGDFGGDALEDMCGTCDDDPANDCVEDCAGVYGGDSVEDNCGVCDADPTNDCTADCAGNFDGTATEDMCGVCDEDPSNDCVQDCAGDFGGDAVVDQCGRCVGGTTGLVACPTATLTVVADAHVISTKPDVNYGSKELLNVDRSSTQTFLKFDLSTLPNDIVIRGLTLRAVAFESKDFGGNGDVNVYFSSDDSWTESTITYETKPAFSDFILASWNVKGLVTGTDLEVEIIDDQELIDSVQAQVFGDKTVTLMLASQGFSSQFYSKESPDAVKHMTMEVAYQVLSKVDVPVVADTYVDDANVAANHGQETTLRVLPTASPGGVMTSFVKFDLSPIPANVEIQRVSLQMLAFSGFAHGGNGNCYTHLVDDDSWDEATLSYENQPTFQPDSIGSWWLWYNSTPADRWGINTSDALVEPTKEAYSTDKLISFRLASSGYRTEYRSREWADATQHPKLTVYFTAN